MNKRTLKAVCAATTLAALAMGPVTKVAAEEIRVPLASKAERSTQQDLPRTGMAQSSVRNGWGSPRQTTGPVGNPPISQWHYEDFVVYFEDDRVIHAVLKPQR
ncbi:hypothetical protein DIT71_09945 [Marinobacter vulgaris]|uniref:Phosphodiesterase n=1 Tax=Marinobacter vulgaris TaxID=1928331 RepID=A0A2V3ZJ79_9GAMM|nr:hypothetical protein [Marinobacter vulgaris]PXX90845.1 hypothetical protein DIT71_09945 [Marinobacter vulgaris]TSJ70178.1 hypothetical protein FPC41_10560 [Marinobacter vulgaris]